MHGMTWIEENKGQSHACNGYFLVKCRMDRGWTQEETANKTGFSERLIRKAERGGNLRASSVDGLAKTFSTPENPIYPEDLVCNPREIVDRFFDAYRTKEKQIVSEIRDILDDDMVIKMGEEGDGIPFSGVFHGIAGFDKCMQLFFATFNRPDKNFYQPKFFVTGNDVISVGEEKGQVEGMPEPITAHITMHFHIKRGKIVHIEDFYDPAVGLKYLQSAKDRGLRIESMDGEVESVFNEFKADNDEPPKEIDSLEINRFK